MDMAARYFLTKEPDILGPHAVLSWRHSAQREREGIPCSPSVAARRSTIHQEALQQVMLSSDVIVWGRPTSSLRLSASPRFLARPQSFCLSVSLSRPPTAVLWLGARSCRSSLAPVATFLPSPTVLATFPATLRAVLSAAQASAKSCCCLGAVVARDAAQLCCPWPHGWQPCAS